MDMNGIIEKEPRAIWKSSKPVLFIVDMNNGFAKKGVLASPRVEKIIPQIAELAEEFKKKGCPIIAFTDSHNKDAEEFRFYPPHCIEGTEESELVDELKSLGSYVQVIKKNSTNGFLEREARETIDQLMESGTGQWVVTGCCTDLCVLQFVLSLRTYFNTTGFSGEIVVPAAMVETYSAPGHDGDEMNSFSMYNMKINGVEITEKVILTDD